jgi:hypothetical protein
MSTVKISILFKRMEQTTYGLIHHHQQQQQHHDGGEGKMVVVMVYIWSWLCKV